MSSILKERIKAAIRQRVNETLAEPVTDYGAMLLKSTRPMTKTKRPGQDAYAMIRAIALGGGNPHSAYLIAKSHYGADSVVTKAIAKAISAGDFTAGGALIPEPMANEVIDRLRTKSVVRAIGPRTTSLARGSLRYPVLTASATASYVGENQRIPLSEPTFGEKSMVAKKLTCMVPLSNEALKYSDSLVEQTVIDDIVKTIAEKEDVSFLYSDGTQNTPKGIRHQLHADHVVPTAGTSSTQIETDLVSLKNKLDGANVPADRRVYIMHSSRYNHLFTLRDSNGNLIYPELRSATPTIHGIPVFVSNNLPTDLGGSQNEFEVFIVEASEVILGEVSGMEVEMSREASYFSATTNTDISAFQNDQTLIRCILQHDLMLRHAEAAAVVSVAWGATLA